jgi:XTP/dITP diphosphohydrolase
MGAPRRRFDGTELVIASHNPGKLREIAALLERFALTVRGASELGLPEPEETGASFIANAELKARAAAQGAGICALADDSGLAVARLDGAPGIYSARWAGPEKDFALAMERVRKELAARGTEPSGARAHFVCALSLCWPDDHCESFEGRVDGRLVFPPRGPRGFGYDPIFMADGYEITFGEMEPEKKHSLSHRADAFAKLIAACFAPVP